MSEAGRGRLVIVSGPSGVGKTSALKGLFQSCPLPLVASVSATTRQPRQGERDGVDYYFLNSEQFRELRDRGEFLECFEVFGRGHWYGTLKREVFPRLDRGDWVVLEVDVQGALSVVESYPQAITIFVRPSTWDVLEARLRGRGTESEDVIQDRLSVARRELAAAKHYKYQVVNDHLDEAVRKMTDILVSESQRK